MSKGTRNLSSLEIAEKVESLGAALGTGASSDYCLLSLKTVTEDFPTIFELAGEMLRYPSFPEQEVELEKKIVLQNLLSQKEQPFNLAFCQLREMIYGQHPYGFSILGTEETVNSFTVADLYNCHQQYFRPDNLVISLAGKINSERATDIVENILGDWQTPRNPSPAKKCYELTPHSDYRLLEQSNQQTIIMLGYLAPEVNHIDYPMFKLLSTYLGNGLSSRLFVELREKKGLAYDVSAFYPTRLDKSQFVTYIGTAPTNSEIAQQGLAHEIQRLRETPLTAEELQVSKNKLLGQYALGKQTNSELAQLYGWYETLGLGVNYEHIFPQQINHITTADIQRIAQEYLKDDYLCSSIVA
jgi:predicted Zn-dependent peptidase